MTSSLDSDVPTSCEEIERGTHACRASKPGPVERWWTQDGKLGITIQDTPLEKTSSSDSDVPTNEKKFFYGLLYIKKEKKLHLQTGVYPHLKMNRCTANLHDKARCRNIVLCGALIQRTCFVVK